MDISAGRSWLVRIGLKNQEHVQVKHARNAFAREQQQLSRFVHKSIVDAAVSSMRVVGANTLFCDARFGAGCGDTATEVDCARKVLMRWVASRGVVSVLDTMFVSSYVA